MPDAKTDTPKPVVFPFGRKALIVYLAFLSAFVPLTTDLYLPALPSMVEVFDTTPQIANFTLSFFMLFFAVSMLLWGPFTDRYGRKPILYTGLAIYIIGSFICIFAFSIWVLIFGSILQAIGSGAIQSVSMAIVKDCFEGEQMERVLVWIQTLVIVAPMLAPIIGAQLLYFTAWQGLFVFLCGCAVIATLAALMLKETLTNPTEGSAFKSLGRVGYVLSHKGYRTLLLIFSMMCMPVMSFLSTSSFVYINLFGLTEQQYSYFFAFNGCFAMLAPIAYMHILRKLPRQLFITTCFISVAVAGVAVLFFGSTSPFAFALLYVPVTFFGSAVRPAGTMLVMTQLDTDNGTVGSLFGCVALLFGSISMLLCSLDWPVLTWAVGIISLFTGLACLILWTIASRLKVFRM
ncbi:MAG: MFS transporter [Oxalobacter sp.]|nr:MFS transporter [Oxalobacter sp.]